MQIRQLTKQAIAAVLSASALLQIPQVTQPLMGAVQHHPHLSSILGGLIVTAALLHDPRVEKVLGLQVTTTTQTAEIVPLSTTPAQPEKEIP